MTKREVIIRDIIDKLKSIRKENGYNTDFGKNVYDWTDRTFNQNELPYCLVYDRESDVEIISSSEHEHTVSLELYMICAEKDNTPNYVRQGRNDVYRALGELQQQLYGRYGGVVLLPVHDESDVQKEDKTIGGLLVVLEMKYLTSAWLMNEPDYL